MHDVTTMAVAFAGDRQIARGPLLEVALAVAAVAEDALVFEEATGRVLDLDLRGGAEAIRAALLPCEAASEAPRGRGRPRLGVVAREVTLLPRHWAWLAAEPGGASQALRRLVEAAIKADEGQGVARSAREAAYRFMLTMAGDRPGFEEATRALFAGDGAAFAQRIADWPADVRDAAARIAAPGLD
ncbi:DUF2239 family protein [Acuticoccus mangrovi]|uniref:DUF2239 family protein n=1 Tax=Acuticoccus mangrovi TaxID=2796142 RepID=A0A934IL71_9HYPH|nr:DUF2239 family protein [Acuticoccus mangrovi]MBJ3775847.1 DUF2239 family protein [Acuticoccus mangrovi]